MVEALRRNGNQVGYFLFSGEQHGFRKAEQHSALPRCGTRLLCDRGLPDRTHVLKARCLTPYCSERRARASKADALAKARRAARPLTKASGSGRSSSGAASIAAPAPITAAGQGRMAHAATAPTRSASAETAQAPNKMARPTPERSDAPRCFGGKWP